MRLPPAAVVAMLLALPAAAAADDPAREQEPIVLTGADPGPKVALRSGDEPRTAADGSARRCWHPEDGLPDGSDRFFQGSIATHGLHLLFLADSDNARQTVPAAEIVSDWNLVMLPGDQGNVGERYGRSFEHPLLATVG
jgi:hypothetical protein